jgi:hypothetical protein
MLAMPRRVRIQVRLCSTITGSDLAFAVSGWSRTEAFDGLARCTNGAYLSERGRLMVLGPDRAVGQPSSMRLVVAVTLAKKSMK